MARRRERTRPREDLVDGAAVDALGRRLAVDLGEEVDDGHGGEELLWPGVRERLLALVPARALEEEA